MLMRDALTHKQMCVSKVYNYFRKLAKKKRAPCHRERAIGKIITYTLALRTREGRAMDYDNISSYIMQFFRHSRTLPRDEVAGLTLSDGRRRWLNIASRLCGFAAITEAFAVTNLIFIADDESSPRINLTPHKSAGVNCE